MENRMAKESRKVRTTPEMRTANARVQEENSQKCHHCGKVGHKKTGCWQMNGKPGEQANNPRLWIANNGSVHQWDRILSQRAKLMGTRQATSEEGIPDTFFDTFGGSEEA